MSKAWSLYLPEVLPEVENCPQIMAVNAVRNAAIEFSEKSWAWTFEFAPSGGSLVADQATYTITPPFSAPQDCNILTLARLGYYAVDATKPQDVPGPYSEAELDRLRPGWREEESTGTLNTVSLFTYKDLTLRIIPIPVVNQADALVATAVLKPARAGTAGPDVLYEDWLEAIAHGAKWKLMALPKKEWSDPDLAGYHEKEFRKGINKALARQIKGGGRQSVTAYPREFGR
jgi:hypothetical protein